MELIQEKQLETWNSITASRDGGDWDSEPQGEREICTVNPKCCGDGEENYLLYSRHLIKEQVHNKQKEALFHPTRGAVVELITTGRCGSLRHKRDMMP